MIYFLTISQMVQKMKNEHVVPHFSDFNGCCSVQTRLQTVQVRTLSSLLFYSPVIWGLWRKKGTQCARIFCLLVVGTPWRFFHLPLQCYSEIPSAWLMAHVNECCKGCGFLSIHVWLVLFCKGLRTFLIQLKHQLSLTGLSDFVLPVAQSVCDLVFMCRYLGLICESP